MENLIGFVTIPGYSSYLVNIDGVVISKSTERVLRASKNGRGYLNYTLIRDNGKRQGLGLHRAIALAFLPDPQNRDLDSLIVNHKDGIKENNHLSNFEWVTYKENSEHAGEFNLTTKCVPVSIRDIEGNVKSFPSFLECGKFLNLSKDAIAWRARRCQTRLCRSGYQYAIGKDVRNWPELDEAIAVYFRDESKFLVFGKQIEASTMLGVSPATLSNRLKEPVEKVYPGNVQIGYLTSFARSARSVMTE